MNRHATVICTLSCLTFAALLPNARAQSQLDKQVSEIADVIDTARQCILRLDSASSGMRDALQGRDPSSTVTTIELASRHLTNAADQAEYVWLGLHLYALMTHAPDKQRAAPIIARIQKVRLQNMDMMLHIPETIVPRLEISTAGMTTTECAHSLRRVQQLIRDVRIP